MVKNKYVYYNFVYIFYEWKWNVSAIISAVRMRVSEVCLEMDEKRISFLLLYLFLAIFAQNATTSSILIFKEAYESIKHEAFISDKIRKSL